MRRWCGEASGGGRRGLFFRASAPFCYGLWSVGGFDGFDGLDGRLWRGCGGENATGVHGGFLGVGWSLGWSVGWSVGRSVGRSNFVFLDAVFFFFRHKGMRVCVFFDTKGVQFLKLKVES